uniref:Uncharacterized protein n=1 Tax=viral metagenome TaxID=1070528 RepID=A0A6C0KJZ3_9ZZZZ
MSVKSVSLTEVAVGDVPTHIVIYREGSKADAKADANSVNLQKKVDDLMTQVERLSKRILHLELDAESRALEVKTTPFFGSSIVPEPTGMHVRRLSDVCDDSKTTLKAIVNGLTPPPAATKIVTIASHVEEVHQEEAEEEEAEAEAEEEEEEAEGEELTEFEYKGTTYYRDSEKLVYGVDDDGDLDDTPIGVWSEEKQKVLRYKQ